MTSIIVAAICAQTTCNMPADHPYIGDELATHVPLPLVFVHINRNLGGVDWPIGSIYLLVPSYLSYSGNHVGQEYHQDG